MINMTRSVRSVERRSQEERSSQMRLRLLDATIECLVEYGYAGTTSPRIAEKSGVTRGAQAHHFGSKNELVIAAVNHLAAKRAETVIRELGQIKAGPDPLGQVLELLWDIHNGPIFDATVELWVASRTDPELAREMAKFEVTVTSTLQSVVAQLVPPELNREIVDFVYTAMDSVRGMRISSYVDSDPERAHRRWVRAQANLRRIASPAVDQILGKSVP